MKKRAWVCVMLSVWLAVGCAPKTVAPSYVSTGDTVLYALYCRDSEVIRRGEVTFDMAAEVMQSEYRVTTDEEVEFAIPFGFEPVGRSVNLYSPIPAAVTLTFAA